MGDVTKRYELGPRKQQELNLAVMLAMRSLGSQLAVGAALCRAFRLGDLGDYTGVWHPGCGFAAERVE